MKRQGFTLIEMLVAVFVFMILFLIAASFINLAAGSTKSNRTKLLTSEIRSAMDTINLKLNGGNGKANSPPIFGFRVKKDNSDNNHQVLGIASSDGYCTMIGYKIDNSTSNGYLATTSMPCTSVPSGNWMTTALTERLTSANVNVTSFDADTGSYFWTGGQNPAEVPHIHISLSAKDADPKYADSNQITIQTLYTMDYETIKRLQGQP